jgi:hypothetical protein
MRAMLGARLGSARQPELAPYFAAMLNPIFLVPDYVRIRFPNLGAAPQRPPESYAEAP